MENCLKYSIVKKDYILLKCDGMNKNKNCAKYVLNLLCEKYPASLIMSKSNYHVYNLALWKNKLLVILYHFICLYIILYYFICIYIIIAWLLRLAQTKIITKKKGTM